MKRNIWLGIGLVALVVILIFAVKNPSGQDTTGVEPIKIGAVLSFTGAASQDGEAIKNGMELARKELASKGVAVEINYQDDATEPKQTVSAIQQVSAWGADAIIGPTWSYLGTAGVPVLDQRKIVGFMPANTSEYVTPGEYGFFGSIKNSWKKEPLVKFFKDNNVKTVVYIGNQGGWGEVNNAVVKEAASEVGATVIASELIPYGQEVQSLNTLLIKVRAQNPDVIVASIEDGQSVSLLFQRIEQYQLKSTVIAATTSIARILHAADTLENVTTPVYTLVPESSATFNAKYKEEYGVDAPPYADNAYEGFHLLVNGILKKGDADLKDYLRENSYKGTLRTWKFDEKGDIEGGTWYLEKNN